MAGIFLTIVQISSEFVGGQCASWRLPPKAAVSAYRRHSFVEGIRNGGLDFLKAAVGLGIGHGDCLLYDGFFSFAVVRQWCNHLLVNKFDLIYYWIVKWGFFGKRVFQRYADGIPRFEVSNCNFFSTGI